LFFIIVPETPPTIALPIVARPFFQALDVSLVFEVTPNQLLHQLADLRSM
jgi:hypothetical protein